MRVTSLSDAGVGSLRAGLETLNAQGGQGELDLRELSGTIALASPLPVIMFHGRLLGPVDGNLSLNGQGRWPLLSFAAGTTSEVHRLILTNALATGYRHGAAISNAGSLVIDSCTLTGNSNHHGWGGAIFNQGDLRMLNSLVAHNSAEGEPTPGAKLVTPVDRVAGLGGAVFHDAGTWFGSNCTFRANTVIGGSGGSPTGGAYGGSAMGGGFFARSGIVELVHCRFEGNRAVGGAGQHERLFGGHGGDAFGGAGMVLQAEVRTTHCQFIANSAEGGPPGSYSDWIFGGSIGTAGLGTGGALSLWGGSLQVRDSLISSNRALGSAGGGSKTGGAGAPGRGGAISVQAGLLTVERSLWTGNRAAGGDGGAGRSVGAGGSGEGGALVSLGGDARVENCTFVDNQAKGGDLPEAQIVGTEPGLSAGGAIAVVALTTNLNEAPHLDLRFCTVASNVCLRSAKLSFFGAYRLESGVTSGGGLYTAGARVRLEGSILAGNQSLTNADLGGSIESVRGNLVQTPGLATGLQPHDLTGLDPGLGPLALQGGPWPTLSLLEGSPAIDRITGLGGPATDQRGQSRPAGNGWDLGAFERAVDGPPTPRFGVPRRDPATGRVHLAVAGTPGSTYRVETSIDLQIWSPGPSVGSGDTLQEDPSGDVRFYRLKSLDE